MKRLVLMLAVLIAIAVLSVAPIFAIAAASNPIQIDDCNLRSLPNEQICYGNKCDPGRWDLDLNFHNRGSTPVKAVLFVVHARGSTEKHGALRNFARTLRWTGDMTFKANSTKGLALRGDTQYFYDQVIFGAAFHPEGLSGKGRFSYAPATCAPIRVTFGDGTSWQP